jgi:hypothetical protein
MKPGLAAALVGLGMQLAPADVTGGPPPPAGAPVVAPTAAPAGAPVVGPTTAVVVGPLHAPGHSVSARAVAARGFTPAEAAEARRALEQELTRYRPLLDRIFDHYAGGRHGYARLRPALDSAQAPGPGAEAEVTVTRSLLLSAHLKASVLYADRERHVAGTAAEPWLRRKIAADVLWSLSSSKELLAEVAALPDAASELMLVKMAQDPPPPAAGATWLSSLAKELQEAVREDEAERQRRRARPMGPPFAGSQRLRDARAEVRLRIGRELCQSASPRVRDVVRFARSLRDSALRDEVLAELLLATPDRHWVLVKKEIGPALGTKGSDLRVGTTALDRAGH